MKTIECWFVRFLKVASSDGAQGGGVEEVHWMLSNFLLTKLEDHIQLEVNFVISNTG